MSVIIQGVREREMGIYYQFDRSAKLGEGGMGSIYSGYMVFVNGERDAIPVAIKEIRDELAANPQLIERAEREASIQIDHDNLLRMYGLVANVEYDQATGRQSTKYYMVMELLPGLNLDQVLNGFFVNSFGMPIPYAQSLYSAYRVNPTIAIATIITSLLQGLKALHTRGYIHRDIDPTNVMITERGIKLIDFGVCKDLCARDIVQLTLDGSFIGKPEYAAPELASGDVNNQNYSTDIYAVGILMYKLAVGRLPFVGTNQEILVAQMTRDVPVSDIADKRLRSIVKKATQKKQAKRYQSAEEMIMDLDKQILQRGKTTDLLVKNGETNFSNGGNDNRSGEVVIVPVQSSSGSAIFWAVGAIAGVLLGLIVKCIVVLC